MLGRFTDLRLLVSLDFRKHSDWNGTMGSLLSFLRFFGPSERKHGVGFDVSMFPEVA
jgi:hypothetical protein